MTTILRLPSVKARTGLSRSSIYAFVSRGEFPSPIALGARAVGWNSESVDAWIAARIDQSRSNNKPSVTLEAADAPPSPQNGKPRARGLGLGLGLRLSTHRSF
jgi:prophage regulatory protein